MIIPHFLFLVMDTLKTEFRKAQDALPSPSCRPPAITG
jgi:hypothetical protein